MGVPTSEVGYTSATTTTGRGDGHEVHKGNEVALEKKKLSWNLSVITTLQQAVISTDIVLYKRQL
jgi:hypothetical protein